MPDIAPKGVFKKDDSQSSFDWNFSAPSSPALPKITIEDVPEEEDVGLTFNFDNTGKNNVNVKPSGGNIQPRTTVDQVPVKENKISPPKKAPGNNTKLKRYVTDMPQYL